MNYIYGPVPSRRLGLSLGISPIPKKTCNYSCIYCQLGRTNKMTNEPKNFFDVKDIIKEFDESLLINNEFDVVTIVGEGEPTLYYDLKELIKEIKKRTDKPVAVITNGALLYEKRVKEALNEADIVLPTFDAYDESTFKKINRPHGQLSFQKVYNGLVEFSAQYKGELWLEMMFIKGVNEDDISIEKYKEKLKNIKYDKLYLNTPVRPPSEEYVKPISHKRMDEIATELKAISIDLLASQGFYSNINDHLEAIKSIIKRHPMNQFEIKGFLLNRKCKNINNILKMLNEDCEIEVISYQSYDTYRLK
ncbi:MAG: radical SAM protein [Candidatus Izemoplasmatales bacterium]